MNQPGNTPVAGRVIWPNFRSIYRMPRARPDWTAAAPNSTPVHPRIIAITYSCVVLVLFTDLPLPGGRSACDRDHNRHPGELIFQADQRRVCGSLAGAVGQLSQHAETIVRVANKAERAMVRLDDARQKSIARRNEGMKLIEENCNPDPLIEQGRAHHSALIRTLNQGDAASANELLKAVVAPAPSVAKWCAGPGSAAASAGTASAAYSGE